MSLARSFNIRITRVLLLLCFLVSVGVHAQSPLEAVLSPSEGQEENSSSEIPRPNNLNPGWWSYVGNSADGEELATRVDDLLRAAESATLTLTVEQSVEGKDEMARLRSNLLAFKRLKGQPAVDENPPVRLDGKFTTEQLFEIVTERRRVELELESLAREVEQRQTEMTRERRQLEQRFSGYQELSPNSTQRVLAGLGVMAQRALVATAQVRLERQQASLSQRKDHLASLREQVAAALASLDFEGFDQSAMEARMADAQTAQIGATEKLTDAEAALNEIDETSTNGRLEAELSRQVALSARIERSRATLDEGLAETQLIFQGIQSAGDYPEDLHEITQRWRAASAEIGLQVSNWREAATNFLLSAPLAVDPGRDAELRRLTTESRELAQENRNNIAEIEARRNQLGLMLDLVERELVQREGPLRRWWVQISLWWDQAWLATTELLNTRLFSIGDSPVNTSGILRILIILLVAFWISFAIRHALDRISQTRAFMSVSSIYTLGRLLHYVIMLSALLIGLGSIGLDFSNLALIAGALSVGIGFGLQSIVSNFVSGLILLFERSLKVGDYVELDSGVTGHVREINIRSTRINTNDNIDVLVPNSEFVSTKLINWTLRESLARLHIDFGVAYGTDKDLVKKATLEAAERVEFTLRNMPGKEPEVWFVNFGDSSLDFQLLVWVSRQGVRRPSRVKAAYLWELHSALEEYGIEVPFPQRDLHVRSGLEAFQGNRGSVSTATSDAHPDDDERGDNDQPEQKGEKL